MTVSFSDKSICRDLSGTITARSESTEQNQSIRYWVRDRVWCRGTEGGRRWKGTRKNKESGIANGKEGERTDQGGEGMEKEGGGEIARCGWSIENGRNGGQRRRSWRWLQSCGWQQNHSTAVPQAQTHKPKPLDGCCVERWSVRGEYSAATGTNTDCPREESNNTVNSKLYTVYCMVAVDVCVHLYILACEGCIVYVCLHVVLWLSRGDPNGWPTSRQVEKQKASFNDERLWSQKIIGKRPNWQKQAWAKLPTWIKLGEHRQDCRKMPGQETRGANTVTPQTKQTNKGKRRSWMHKGYWTNETKRKGKNRQEVDSHNTTHDSDFDKIRLVPSKLRTRHLEALTLTSEHIQFVQQNGTR